MMIKHLKMDTRDVSDMLADVEIVMYDGDDEVVEE
jgi:hypothetical protein